ncbi:MAG: family 10 glycosylhydrolase [Limnochordia bacterium]
MRSPLYRWVIVVLVVLCTQAYPAIQASDFSVTSQVRLNGPKAPDEVEYIDLAGLRSDSQQTIGSLRLVHQPGMFFSTWNLVWYSTQSAGDGRTQTTITELQRNIILYPGHQYQTVLQIGAADHNGAVCLMDVTDGRILYFGDITIESSDVAFQPYAELYGTGEVQHVFVGSARVPTGMNWRITSLKAAGSPAVRPMHPADLMITTDATADAFSGQFQLVSETAPVAGLNLKWVDDNVLVPTDPSRLPLGEHVMHLEYVAEGQIWRLGRDQVQLVGAQIETMIILNQREQRVLSGELRLTADTDLGSVDLTLWADIDVWRFDNRWYPVDAKLLVAQETLTLHAGREVLLPFQMENPAVGAKEPCIYRIRFSYETEPDRYVYWTSPFDATFTWTDAGGHKHTKDEHFVRVNSYDWEPTEPTVYEPLTLETLRRWRSELAHRTRRIIFNNDGNDVLGQAPAPTPDGALLPRTYPLAVSQVDAIFYCPWKVGIVNTTRKTDIGHTLLNHPNKNNITGALIEQGVDSLQVMVDFGKRYDIEVFWSLRMNDTHDAGDGYEYAFKFKDEHPEYLVSTRDSQPWVGRWSAWDYGRSEVRDMVYNIVAEVVRNYDIDGIELDFFRHPQLFKSVSWGEQVTQTELDMITDLMRRIRTLTEEAGLQRGRPILVAIRVPDSIEFCRAYGIDLQTWLAEGLFDILTTTDYFQLNPWEYTVELGRKYGVAVYAGLSQSRIAAELDRNAIETYRARASSAWRAGVDGVYMFNIFNPLLPHFQELGDPLRLQKANKIYTLNYVNNYTRSARTVESPNTWVIGGAQYVNTPLLSPRNPQLVRNPVRLELDVADQVGEKATVLLRLQVRSAKTGSELAVRLNGQPLGVGTVAAGWLQYPVDPALLKQGQNTIELEASPEPGQSMIPTVMVEDLALHIRY